MTVGLKCFASWTSKDVNILMRIRKYLIFSAFDLAVFFLTSIVPLLVVLSVAWLDEGFKHLFSQIAVNVSYSTMAASIFYFLTIWLPRYRDKKNIAKYVRPLNERIHGRVQGILHEIASNAKIKIPNDPLSIDAATLSIILSTVNPHANVSPASRGVES